MEALAQDNEKKADSKLSQEWERLNGEYAEIWDFMFKAQKFPNKKANWLGFYLPGIFCVATGALTSSRPVSGALMGAVASIPLVLLLVSALGKFKSLEAWRNGTPYGDIRDLRKKARALSHPLQERIGQLEEDRERLNHAIKVGDSRFVNHVLRDDYSAYESPKSPFLRGRGKTQSPLSAHEIAQLEAVLKFGGRKGVLRGLLERQRLVCVSSEFPQENPAPSAP